jgi:hypothetical protein
MIKIILLFLVSSTISNLCFSNTMLYLPSDITVEPNNPAAAFPKDIQQYFSISANLHNNACKKPQAYMLTMLIYRSAVDNKMVSTYRTKDGSSPCWIDLISYSDEWVPNKTAGGWKIPKASENTWCSSEGLKNPLLCNFALALV